MRAAAILILFLAGSGTGVDEADRTPAACPTTGDWVAVFTLKREIWLCRHGSVVGRIPVALGRGGTGKRRTGDRRFWPENAALRPRAPPNTPPGRCIPGESERHRTSAGIRIQLLSLFR